MITVENLTFRYANSKEWIIQDLSFQVRQGEVLAVLGPSGGGKSTLLRLLAGLERPADGKIMLDSRVVASNNLFVEPEKRGIGMLFQDYALFPHMSVCKNIGFGLRGLNRNEKNQRALQMLELVNLQGFENRYPYELSGGQQQRIALARAIAPNPKVLFLDEPFSNLDADLVEQIRDDLFQILRKLEITTVMVTHHREDAERYADRILKIES